MFIFLYYANALINSISYVTGYSIGSLLGGLLYRGLGGRGAFQSMGLIALVCCISHIGLHRLVNKTSPQSEIPSAENVHLQVTSDKNYATNEIVKLKSNRSLE
jgi:predicted MFS family arabinose efflux permease